ncbi:unnamed protein product, partial [Haemonchus placei]|uniref:GST C-terminal domain-containing protein n=1 Tax=Haemonchus placei TaxID=6290 RepID=A0A0N4WW71_HAEPC
FILFFHIGRATVELRKHDWKSDTVYLYQFPRPKTIPNLSPYCLKVETFLKVNKIPYEVSMGRSRYGLLPFIELNGEHIADSEIIIDRLKDHFKVKVHPSFIFQRIAAAIGQFPVEDFKKFLQKDFDTYRDLLGDKKFLFGDEISSADCAVFSQLAAVLYIPPNNYVKELLREKYPELTNYCDRIRDTVFGKEFAQE